VTKRLITILVILAAVGFLGYKIWDLAWNRPPELKEAHSRLPYATIFAHVRDVAYPNVLRHARRIARFGSRQTGQVGCDLTVQYVQTQLRQMGFKVKRRDYEVTVPVEHACSVSLYGADRLDNVTYEAHALMPNNVQTSPTPRGGLRGSLVYLGFGTPEEWNGREVQGSIAVLEFNSGDAWLRAIERGAKGVVFLEPKQTSTREADLKYIDLLPLRATRVYVWGKAAATIRRRARANVNGSIRACVVSRQTLDTAPAPYLEVEVQGSDPRAKTLILTCDVDARSIVPEMSFGGDEVWGIATWLELARWFKTHPPRNTVRLVAFTGHWQDFTGSRNYVSEHLDEIGKSVPLVMGVDLSTEGKYLALVPRGWPQRGGWRGPYRWLEKLIWHFRAQMRQNWTDDIEAETGLRVKLFGDSPPEHPWINTAIGPGELHNPASLAGRHYVSSETWLVVGGQSLAWQTAESRRPRDFTPLDTFEASYARRTNLAGNPTRKRVGQLEALFAFLDNIVEIEGKYFPKYRAHRLGIDRSGYVEFHGQIKRYDEKTAWYKGGLPPDRWGKKLVNTYVYMYPYDIRLRRFQQTVTSWHPLAPNKQKHRGMQSYGIRYLTKVDKDGRFSFKTVFYRDKFTRYTFLAFSLDDEGRILYASDLGRHGADEFKYLNRVVETDSIDQSITVFPCGAVTLFGLIDSKRYSIGSNIKDTWFIQWTGNQQEQDEGLECYMPVSEVKLYPSQTDAKSYLIAQYQKTAMVFLPAGKGCEILMTRGVLKRFSLLRSLDPAVTPKTKSPTGTNAADARKRAADAAAKLASKLKGITLKQGEDHQVTFTPLVLARQMHRIDAAKLARYGRFGVRSQQSDIYFDNAATLINRAEQSLEAREERNYRSDESRAWGYESDAYQSIFRLLYDVVSTTIFYFTLLIPFSYLMERLLFPQKTYVKSAAVAGIVFVVFVGLLLQFHPGFKLAGNIYVAIVSFLIIVFTLPAFFMIVGQGLKMLKAAGSQYFQRHASEAERMGVLVAALSLSVANMRRRKLRTALTLGTISLLVLSLVLLTHTTSTSTTYPTNEPPMGGSLPYDGIQVTNTHYHNFALFRETVALMEDTYGDRAIVLPRRYGYYGIRTGLKGFESVRLYGPYPPRDFRFYDLLGHRPSLYEMVTFPLRVTSDAALRTKAAKALGRPKAWAPVPIIQFASPDEPKVTHVDETIVSGRWFTPDDVDAVIISDETAESIGARVGDELTIEGFRVKVVGIFATMKASIYDLLGHRPSFFETLRFPLRIIDEPALATRIVKYMKTHRSMDDVKDVTGDSILPIKLEINQPTPEEPTRYTATRVIFMPQKFQERYAYFPSAPYSVVIVPHDHSLIPKLAGEIAKNFENIDVYSSYKGKLDLISAFHTARVTGGGLMVMPLVVSFLMIFSVMMGSVHERTREIYIFSSVGLSPKHVAGMFLIESIVYAGIASVWGYFIGIILLHVFRVEGLLPETFYPNYLGVFVIYSVGLAMLATVSSSLYPMYKASRIANPSLERTWRIDTEPTEDSWDITFPFISTKESETRGILAFLKEFIEHHAGEGQGVFAVLGDVTYEADVEKHDHRLRFDAWLAPFERNVTQSVVLEARKAPERVRWTFHFALRRRSGVRYMWLKSNKAFVDVFRKEMLVWRGFSDEVLAEYARRGNRLAGIETVEPDGETE